MDINIPNLIVQQLRLKLYPTKNSYFLNTNDKYSRTKQTKSIAVVVSESSVVRIFDGGELVTEILPELWLLNRHGIHINAPFTTQKTESIAVACIKE